MAKKLLLNTLHDVLSDYVKDLSPEKLKVGVWSGKIVLNDLQVNPDAVNQLRLPVKIIHGTIKTLEVDIPWVQLRSKPVKVKLEGVCVLVGPVDKDTWGDDEVQARRLNIKRQLLEKAEASANKTDDKKGDAPKKGFVDKLVQRIVDNIEISVSDIHLRYEDTALVPGQTVSAGLCLESFIVATTDEEFEPQFVDRTKKGNRHSKVHKLARVKGFSMYWRIDDKERFADVIPERRSSALRDFIKDQADVPSGEEGGLAHGHLIRPTGAVLKLIHSDDPQDTKGPMFEVSFEVDDVGIDLHAEQYEQALSLKDSFVALSNWQTFYAFRPKTSPMEDPKAWWRYAYVCVVKKKGDVVSKMRKTVRARKEYITLFKKLEEAEAVPTSTVSKKRKSPLTSEQDDKFDSLEGELPVQAIVVFRKMARQQLKQKRDGERAKKDSKGDEEEEKSGGGGGWWGLIWSDNKGGDKDGDEEGDDVDLDDIAEDLEGEGKQEMPPDHLQVRATVMPQGFMRLYGRHDLPLVEAKLAASATFEMKEDSSMACSFQLSRLHVLDLFTKRAVFTHLLEIKGNDQDSEEDETPENRRARKAVEEAVSRGVSGAIERSKRPVGKEEDYPLVCVNVSLSKDALGVELCALPMNVAYNREVVDAMMSVFSARPTETEAAMSNVYKGVKEAQRRSEELTKLKLSISLDVAAPKIIVPTSSSHDRGFALLDMGHVVVRGGTEEDGSMEYTAEVSDITARFPLRKALLVSGTGDTFIEPFKVKAQATIREDASKPSVELTVDVLPGIVGVISPAKIRQMFLVLDYVTKADLEDDQGDPPVGVAGPNTASGGGGFGVEVMADGEEGVLTDEGSSETEKDKEEKQDSTVAIKLLAKLPKISMLLVHDKEDASNKNAGILMEAAGMSMEVETGQESLVVNLHLAAVTLEDRARPDGSRFRNIIYSTPDESSRGGLIHVTFWAALGGVRRVPPLSIADTDKKEYDMVVDARFSTLQVAVDKHCILEATPFFKAVTRQDMEEPGRRRRGTSGIRNDSDTRSNPSVASQLVKKAKRAAVEDPKAILAKASMTSLVFELVRADPWETVMQAAVSGLSASVSADSSKEGGTDASVTLSDIMLTDVRSEAEDNAFRMILAPLAPSAKKSLEEGKKENKVDGEEEAEEHPPLISVTAKMDNATSSLDVDAKLASFACNLMVEPIKKSLVVMMDLNVAVMDMVDNSAPDESEASELDAVIEEEEDEMEDSEATCEASQLPFSSVAEGAEGTPTPNAPGEEGSSPLSSISARCSLDDWRVNLIENPSKAGSRMVVLRASVVTVFNRTVTSGEGGESTEDTVHLTLSEMESLVDQPSPSNGSRERKISQLLEPIAAECHGSLLTARGTPLSANIRVMSEALEARVSYRDVMLVKGIVEQALASDESGSESGGKEEEHEEDSGEGGQKTERTSLGRAGERTSLGRAGERSSHSRTSLTRAGERTSHGRTSLTRAGERTSHRRTSLSRIGETTTPKTMTAISFSAECSRMRVVLINDYEGQGVPVLRLSSQELKAEGSGFKEDFSLEMSAAVEAASFNVKVAGWEPLVEPWRPQLKATLKEDLVGRTIISADLSCSQVVILDVTCDFLESFLSTYWMLFSAGAAEDGQMAFLSDESDASLENDNDGDASVAPSEKSSSDFGESKQLEWSDEAVPLQMLKEGSVLIKNRSGLSLVVGSTDYPQKSVPVGPMETVPLPLETQQGRANAEESHLRGKSAFIGWDDEDLQNTREALPPMEIDRTGVFVFPIKPAEALPSEYVVSAPVVVEALQNQRYHIMERKWKKPFMPGDGPEFTVNGWSNAGPKGDKERPLESFRLPDEDKWEWIDDWHVDYSRKVGKQINATGWEYAMDFSGLSNDSLGGRTHRDLDRVRRRKWVRTRAPKRLPMDDPFRPLHLVWEVDATAQGRLEATIRSKVQVKNSTAIALDVRALCSAWAAASSPGSDARESISSPSSGGVDLGSLSLGSVAPGCTLDMPVKMVYASHFQVRPSSTGSAAAGAILGGAMMGTGEEVDFEWSTALPLLANSVDTCRDDWVSCGGKRDISAKGGEATDREIAVKLVVHAESKSEGCVLVTVLPPVTVVNALPCPVSFHASLPRSSAEGDQSSRPKVIEAGKIPTAETAYLHSPEVGDGAELSAKISRHGWSGTVRLLATSLENLRLGDWAKGETVLDMPCIGSEELLRIRCQYEALVRPSCPALKLTLFCSHWLVDRSGLRLGFGVSEKKRLPVPAEGASKEEEDDAATEAELQPKETGVHVSPVNSVSCASEGGTVVTTATVGGLLYSDREYTFKADSLPEKMRGATMIRTSCSDKRNDSQFYLRFRVAEASTVHVLYDRRCSSPPEWLTSEFRATSMRVKVSHKTKKGKVAECPLGAWTRSAPAGSWVNLGGNKAHKADTMYLVVITEEDLAIPLEAAAATIKRTINSREDLEESWAIGTEGLSLCNSPEEIMRVAVPEGAGLGGGGDGGGVGFHDEFTKDAWSDELDVPPGTQGVFKVKGTRGEMYELALRSELCPGLFRRTTQVTVVPRYCLVNLLADEKILLKERGAPDASAVSVPPGGRIPWHWLQGNRGKAEVSVRTEGTAWSYGDIVIDSVGTTALHLPFFSENEEMDEQHRGQAGGPPMKQAETFDESDSGGSGRKSGKVRGPTQLSRLCGEQTVVHVDVGLADDNFKDEYAVLVVFWKATDRRFTSIYSAHNSSPVAVRMHQAGAGRREDQILKAKASWRLEHGDKRQLGWAYPAQDRSLCITAGVATRSAELKTDTIGNYVKIPTGLEKEAGPEYVWASVMVKDGTKVVRVSSRSPPGSSKRRANREQQQQEEEQPANMETEAAIKRKRESEDPTLRMSVNMRGFGLSLVGPIDGRRQEIIYAQMSDFKAKISQDRLSSLQVSVGAIQVDNFLPDGLYPVIVSKRPDDSSARTDKGKDNRQEKEPFLQMTIIREINESTNTAHYDYVAFRMLEVDVMADRSTLLNMLVISKPMEGYLLMWKEQLDSRAWVARRTAEVLERGSSEVPGGYVDVDKVRRTARIQRTYFKTMRFHPIIARISYARTIVSEELVAAAGLPIINKIPSIVKSHVSLSSYLVEDAFGSIKDIRKNVISHYTMAASTQVLNLVGSVRALGSPADLITNVGRGAKTLVYAPVEGLVQGPAEFFEGVGRGAQGFVKGTLTGVFNSVAGVGGAATDAVSRLTFDEDYRRQRLQEKNKAMAQQGGLGPGIKQGGQNILGGIKSGLSGIVTAPAKEAKTGGTVGFFRGVGKGVVGAVVKPVVGVSDAAVSLAQGISDEADRGRQQHHLRPKRALTKDSETGDLVLKSFSMEAAEAQELIENGVVGKGKGSNDKYESHAQVGDLTTIFADTRLVLIKRTKNDRLSAAKMSNKAGKAQPKDMITKTWEEISGVYIEQDTIVIKCYEGGNLSLRPKQESSREELYRQFYAHRNKMGDPTSVRSPKEIFGSKGGEQKAPKVMTMRAHSTAVQESLRDYRFGEANSRRFSGHRLSSHEIVDKAEKQLESVGVGNWSTVDEIAWELVQNWDIGHSGLGARRCLCVVFINASTSTVQFTNISKREGHEYRMLMSSLYNHDAHQLLPGGVAILFGWGSTSNILKKGFVEVAVETTAFSAVFASQREKVIMTHKGGFQAGFLEKTSTEWWSKLVVVVK